MEGMETYPGTVALGTEPRRKLKWRVSDRDSTGQEKLRGICDSVGYVLELASH